MSTFGRSHDVEPRRQGVAQTTVSRVVPKGTVAKPVRRRGLTDLAHLINLLIGVPPEVPVPVAVELCTQDSRPRG